MPKSAPKLDCEKVTIFKVGSSTLDKFIKSALGKRFNFAAREAMESCSYREVSVGGGLSADEMAAFEQQMNTNWDECSTEDILSYCATKGWLEEGDYFVSFND